jgi:predicted outer membrane repeat protein
MTFENGIADGIDAQGGAISQVGSGMLAIDETTFFNNSTSGNGGAIYLTSTPSLKITNSVLNDNTATGDGGAIYVASSLSGITLTNSIVTNNSAVNGGGIAVAGALLGKVTISGTEAFSNEALGRGGVLWNINPSTNFTLNIIRNSFFFQNSGGDGGVVYIAQGLVRQANITDSGADGNKADDVGGVFFFDRVGTIAIKGSGFGSNESLSSGGVFFVYTLTGSISVTNAEIADNKSTGGSVFYVGDALAAKNIQFSGSTIFNNRAPSGNGGVLYVLGFQGAVKISGTEMYDNYAELHGGAILLPDANLKSLTISKSTFTTNSAAGGNGGVICLGVPGEAAGMASSVSISKSTFTSNIAGHAGGAMFLQTAGKMSITGTTFNMNVAAEGGGAVYVTDLIRPATITSSTFVRNVTTFNRGGALLLENASLNTVSISRTLFEGNNAQLGGAIYANEAAVKITSSYFKENRAGTSGGGIYATGSGSTLSITGSTFEANFASSGGAGGAIRALDAFLTMSKTLFFENFAATGSSVWFRAGEFHGNCFDRNANFSVFDDVGGNDVTQNWWNDPGGPNQGTADNYLTAGTTEMYAPWLVSRPSGCPPRPAP